MRWKIETQEQRFWRMKEQGERRFALLPTMMDDGTLLWLEHYWVYYEGPTPMFPTVRKAIRREDAEPVLLKRPPLPTSLQKSTQPTPKSED